MDNFNRTFVELQSKASLWWPKELTTLEASTSIIPNLIETQDKFISILNLTNSSPEQIFSIIESANFPANLFLKHLVVLSDVGGEKLQRYNSNFDSLFPENEDGSRIFQYYWRNEMHEYIFQGLPIKRLDNSKLKIDGKGLLEESQLDDLKRDVIMLLLFGSNAEDEGISANLNNCMIGNLLGKKDDLEEFIKQRYIHVSRITGGAEANSLGQIAQKYVMDFLKNHLTDDYNIVSNGHITGVTHNEGRTETTFDIVVSKGDKSVAIEISFQVTTNSTIERKAGQAQARHELVTSSGNFIAYIIDGAGNFQRKSAITTICEYSQCTVAFTEEELTVLIGFITEHLL
ncbi:hypothetical protein [Priestia flexa]|uniref:Restriction endonuclease n=1 Tax=Priestia flexa TaxID=86664 RepID=A0A8I1MJK3_9BACI|nr:hypothetical protein [Priestia flexa]MBN8253259.1 hypothetical protein [Priestia flexa]